MPPRDRNPALTSKIDTLALPLAPLVKISTGEMHSSFPARLLNFYLLTDAELDALAHHYDQRTPNEWTGCYPQRMNWHQGLTIEDKRRKWGRFMGLQGCETPHSTGAITEDMIWEGRGRAREEEEMIRRKYRHY
jgi:hypothetical protein